MANQTPLAASDPFRWHESVLSTRSLSYMSTISALGANGLPSPLASRNPSIAHMYPPPQSSMDEDSEYELVMADGRAKPMASEEALPSSVAHSILFALPKEIRERIWYHCVVAEGMQIEWPSQAPRIFGLAPQLLQTCKIICSEATPLLYAWNNFIFTHPTDANIFVRAMTPPQHSSRIQFLNLHMHTKDTRLWMTYLGSNIGVRGLKQDFPHLRQLTIRYKSIKWQHNQPIDVNMRMWSEDRHLEELTDGLRQIYYPPFQHLNTSGLDEQQLATLKSYEEADSEMQDALRDPRVRAKLQELRRLQEKALEQPRVIRVRIICVCRVHPAQLQALTAPLTQEDMHALQMGLATRPGLQQLAVQNAAGGPPLLRMPVREGDEFLGFTAVDFKGRAVRRSDRAARYDGNAVYAQTVFLNRKSIMWALEVYALE